MYARHVQVALCLAACCLSASAQEIYRCGNAYSQKPCPGGAVIEAADARSQEQRTAADSVAKRDGKLAGEMEAARTRREAQPVSAYIPKPAAKEKTPPLAHPDVFRAQDGARPKKKKVEPKKKKES